MEYKRFVMLLGDKYLCRVGYRLEYGYKDGPDEEERFGYTETARFEQAQMFSDLQTCNELAECILRETSVRKDVFIVECNIRQDGARYRLASRCLPEPCPFCGKEVAWHARNFSWELSEGIHSYHIYCECPASINIIIQNGSKPARREDRVAAEKLFRKMWRDRSFLSSVEYSCESCDTGAVLRLENGILYCPSCKREYQNYFCVENIQRGGKDDRYIEVFG